MSQLPPSRPRLVAACLASCWLAGAMAAAAGEDAPPPVVERAVRVGSGLRVGIANPAAERSAGVELVVTTRAGGRLVGSARHTIDPMAPGDELEAWIPLTLWGAGRPELRAALIRAGCCTTRLWLEPGGAPLEIEHTLDPAAVGSGPPGERKPAQPSR